MNEDDRKYLEELMASIWKLVDSHNGRERISLREQTRILTIDEKERIKVIAALNPVTIYNTDWGFGIGMTIWSHPTFPGTPVEAVFGMTAST